MGPLATGGVIGVIALVLFMSGMPIAFALGLTAAVSILLFLDPAQFDLFSKFVFDSLNDFSLLAIPLFILMGDLFGGSAASKRLFEAGEAWLSRVRGGLGMSSIGASAVFAALTGSSPATAAAIGRVAIPEMLARGISTRVAAGAVAAGGTLGILIPPSITLILYGIASEQSIGQLFAGGILPGILITLMFCAWIFIATTLESGKARRSGLTRALASAGVVDDSAVEHPGGGGGAVPASGTSGGGTAVLERDRGGIPDRPAPEQPTAAATVTAAATAPGEYVAPTYTWGDRFASLVKVLPFLVIIAGILFVLYRGVATPSEAAAVGVVFVLALIAILYRNLTGRGLLKILLDATNQSTMILLITAFSAVIGTVLSFLSVPQELAATVSDLEVNRWVVMFAINVVLLVLGLFLPPVSIIVMVTPVLFPLIIALGFDPIWFGVIMTVNMEMGLITPPVGLNLYVIKGIAPDIPLKDILTGTLPYVGVLALAIVIMAIFPGIVTWLPNLLFG